MGVPAARLCMQKSFNY